MKEVKSYKLPDFNEAALFNHIQSLVDRAPNGVVQLVIDTFCGAGGVSEGIEQARYNNKKNSVIVIGINHDKKAIYSQAVNHPLAFYTSEDIRLANLVPMKRLVSLLRERFPQCPIILWSSLECTNHSNAKGGQSRDEDSRTLAWDLNRYITELNPDGIWIENVKEFELWGPLIEKVEWTNRKGKKLPTTYPPVNEQSAMRYWWEKIDNGEIGTCPVDWKFAGKGKHKRLIDWGPVWITDWRFAGTYFKAWTDEINSMGYHFQKRVLNAADFGAPTNRYRFFVLFMRTGWPIIWPESTHSKEGGTGLFHKEKHVAVRTCLNFAIEGRSVFEKGHVESDNTWQRIYEGLIKFVAGGKDRFMVQRNGGLSRVYSIDGPARTLTTTGGNQEMVNIKWISKYFSSHNNTKKNAGQSVDEPCHTVTTYGAGALIEASFIDVIYGNGYASSLDEPAPTLRTKDGQSLVKPEFLLNYQGQSRANSTDEPAPTLMQKEKLALIGVKYFISKAYKSGSKNISVEDPSGALTQVPKADLVQIDGWIGDEQFKNIGQSLDDPLNTITASKHYHYLYNPGWFGSVSGINDPCITIIARQDKAPLYLTSAEQGEFPVLAIPVFDTDSPILIKVKEFMVMYDIYDIKKRMLMIPELLKIQSFPENYFLAGTQTDQKKFIGNAVPPKVAKAIAEAMYGTLINFISQNIAA